MSNVRGSTFFGLAALVLLGLAAPAMARDAVHERDCGDERSLSSIRGSTSVDIRIRNSSGSERDLYWLGYDGLRVFYQKLGPGETTTQQTYATHPWVVTDSGGHCRIIFIATRRDGWYDIED